MVSGSSGSRVSSTRIGSPYLAGVAEARTNSHRGVTTAVPKAMSLGLTRCTRILSLAKTKISGDGQTHSPWRRSEAAANFASEPGKKARGGHGGLRRAVTDRYTGIRGRGAGLLRAATDRHPGVGRCPPRRLHPRSAPPASAALSDDPSRGATPATPVQTIPPGPAARAARPRWPPPVPHRVRAAPRTGAADARACHGRIRRRRTRDDGPGCGGDCRGRDLGSSRLTRPQAGGLRHGNRLRQGRDRPRAPATLQRRARPATARRPYHQRGGDRSERLHGPVRSTCSRLGSSRRSTRVASCEVASTPGARTTRHRPGADFGQLGQARGPGCARRR